MGAWVDHVGLILLDASLSAAVLLSLIALVMLGCRQPGRRLILARAAILSSLALFPLAAISLFPRVELFGLFQGSPLSNHPFFTSINVLSTPSSQLRDKPDPQHPDRAPGTVVAARRREFPPRVLVAAYLGGLGCGLAGLVIGFWGLGWLTRRSRAPSAAAEALYNGLPFAARRQRPGLRVVSRIRRPVLIGLFRQVILVPSGLDIPEASEQLRLSLLHELAHAERRDPWFTLASSLSQVVWFFLPPLWWIRSQMLLDQEFLADRRAADGIGSLPVYASSLLALASPEQAGAPALPPSSRRGSETRSPLFQRMLMLVNCPYPVEANPPQWWSWMLPPLVYVVAIAVSTLSLRTSVPSTSAAAIAAPGRTEAKAFRMARLNLASQAGTLGRRPAPFELPVRLPRSFDLVLEAWGNASALAKTRVLGLSLAPAVAPPHAAEPATWHLVHILRDADGLSLSVDDRTVPLEPSSITATWLTLEPSPRDPGSFRNLVLSW